MTPFPSSCITLDYLEIYCHRNSLKVGCRSDQEEVWVSELGPEANDLTQAEIHQVLRECREFELRRSTGDGDEELFETAAVVSRPEMEARLRSLLN